MGAIASTAVIGTGRMAPGIAAAFAEAGARVVVVGRSLEKAQLAAGLAGQGVEARSFEAAAMRGVQLVCETVTEDAATKAAVYRQIEPWLEPGALLTTNTSSLRIGELARVLRRPDAFAGLHFLYPAEATAVVEVVAGESTSAETVAALRGFARQMDKVTILARRDVPGFVWNRLQVALLREALWLLDQGVADVEAIDAAVSDGLAPRWLATGPFATVDLGGSHTWARVAEELFPALATDTTVARSLSERGASDKTFYEWSAEERRQMLETRAKTLSFGREITAERRPKEC